MLSLMTLTRAEELLQVQTAEDVEAIISSTPSAEWRPLGGREQNFPIVNVGADPGDALIERVTNGMDALIDRAMSIRNIPSFESPRQAVAGLFDIPNGRLANLKDTGRRRELAKSLKVSLRDSGEKQRPTVVVEDNGIGQHPNDFPTTLLSLNESNKRTRHELLGAYGQGGSSVFAFTPYSIFVSRRDPALLRRDQQDRVGWTIVRFNPLDENHKHGVYEYLVVRDEHSGLQIPCFDPGELPETYREFVGCHFVAVNYRLDRHHDVVFHTRASLWHLLNVALFDPVYPILIRDERPRAMKEDRKRALDGIVVNGNATRLEEDKRDKIEYSNTHAIQLDQYGTVMLRYHVLKDSGDPKSDWGRMANYISQELAVTITLNGQRQGMMRRDIFKRLGLLSIGNAIIVQVDCDGLTRKAKWELFSTTRDRIKDSPVAVRLENEIRNAIGSDKQLRDYERERKERALSRQSETEAKKIHKWLNEAIKGLRQGLQPVYRKVISTNTEYQLLGDQPLLDEATADTDQTSLPENVHLTDPPAEPTTLRILNPIVRVPVGGTGVVRLAMDAPDDFISPEPGLGRGGFSAQFTRGSTLFRLTGFSAIRRGVMRATIAVVKGVPPGEQGRVIFAITRPSSLPLLAEADVVTVETTQARAKPAGTKAGMEPGPNVKDVNREGWLGLGLSEDVLARVEEDPTDQTVTIYVYKEYPKLMDRLRRERLGEGNVVPYQSKFVASMALAAWLQHQDQKETESTLDQDLLDAELRRAAELFLFSQYVAKDTDIE